MSKAFVQPVIETNQPQHFNNEPSVYDVKSLYSKDGVMTFDLVHTRAFKENRPEEGPYPFNCLKSGPYFIGEPSSYFLSMVLLPLGSKFTIGFSEEKDRNQFCSEINKSKSLCFNLSKTVIYGSDEASFIANYTLPSKEVFLSI